VQFSPLLAGVALMLTPAWFVQPTWAQTPSISGDRSQCVSRPANGTPAGDRPMTRNDVATGLNECLNQVDDLQQQVRSTSATKTDLESLIQRQRELNLQIRSVNDRLGTLLEK
jgi:hypothetical protein